MYRETQTTRKTTVIMLQVQSLTERKQARSRKAIQILCTLVALFTVCTTQAQNIERDKDGNWITIETQKAQHDSTTTYTAKIEGRGAHAIEEPVYIGKKGGYYVARISKKSGRYYRKYLKKD